VGEKVSNFKPIKKAARFTFVAAPKSIFGWELNKRLFLWIKSFWTRSINPACPQCDQGVMLARSNVEMLDDGGLPNQLQPWVCNHCGYALLEANIKRVRLVVSDQRLERAKEEFGDMELKTREQLARNHRISSRIFFLFAIPTFAYAVYMISTGVAWMPTINWAVFSFMFWVFGMKRSYRSWQVLSGHIFETGAFGHWFKHEKWLI
jgi:uncharacterized membrane protein/ribosomal protein S27AE